MLRHVGRAMLCLLTLAAMMLPVPLMAQADEANTFTKLIGTHTMAFGHFRAKEVSQLPMIQEFLKGYPGGLDELDKEVQKLTTVKMNEIETVSLYFDMPRLGGGRIEEPAPPYFLVRTTVPINRDNLKKSVGVDAETINFGKHEFHMGKKGGVAALDDKTLFFVIFDQRSRSRERASVELIPYFAMMETGGEVPYGLKNSVELAKSRKHQMVMGIHVSKEMGQVAEEAMKNAPAAMSPFKSLAKARSGLLTLDYLPAAENDMRMQCNLHFEDEAAAKAGQGAVKFAIALAKIGMNSMPRNADTELKQVTQMANKLLDAIKTEVKSSEVQIVFETKTAVYMSAVTAAVVKVRRAADQMLSGSNMRQLMIAMHNYHNDYARMPPSVFLSTTDKKPAHSWRVLILPYIEQDNIIKQLQFHEPWNSKHNLKVFESVPMPKIFQHPGVKNDDKKTYYKVFTSKPGTQPAAGFSVDSKLTLGQLTVQDGTSNTLAMIEAGPPVLWYQPDDIEYDPQGTFPKLESPWPDNRVNCAFFDGSVRNYWLGQHEDIWRALITRNGGENVDSSKLEEKPVKNPKE
jgi:prepilin-type processing-associated H-X9-DG protein